MMKPRGIRHPLVLVLALVVQVFAAGLLSAQVDHSGPGLPAGPTPGAPLPAVVDTAVAVLEWTGSGSGPANVSAVGDSVVFGEILQVVLDFPEPMEGEPSWEVADGADWLVPVPRKEPGWWDRLRGRSGPAPDLPDSLTATEGARSILGCRIYRTQPFRIMVGDVLSPVITVVGRVAGTGDIAAIRAPRPVGFSLPVLIVMVLALILIVVLGWFFWDRKRGGDDLEDRELPVPAWLAAGIELRDLYWAGDLGRGDSRVFLDHLAGVVRRFVARRYRVAAQEMTGREIINACARLGHSIADPGAFARIIDELDLRRYNPEAASAAWCREKTILLFHHMGRVRVVPRYTDVPADRLLEGEKAWAELRREFPAADFQAGRTGQSNSATGGGAA